MLLAGPARRGLARRPLLGPSLPALPASCRCHRRPLSTGEPYMTDVREITPGMESDLGDGVPLPSEPEQEAPRTSRERLAAFLEMRCEPLAHLRLRTPCVRTGPHCALQTRWQRLSACSCGAGRCLLRRRRMRLPR